MKLSQTSPLTVRRSLKDRLPLQLLIVKKEPQVEDIASYWVDAVDSADAVTLVLALYPFL